MNILHVAKIVGIAGAENYLLKILPELVKHNVHIEFLCLVPKNLKGKEVEFCLLLEKNNIKVHTVYYSSIITFINQKKIKKILPNFDLIHTHLIHADFFIALINKLSKTKFKQISTKHGHDESYTNRYGFKTDGNKVLKYHYIAKFSEKQILKSFAISQGLRKLFIAHKICDESRIDTIYYGFDYDNDKIQDKFRRSENQLLLVGRFTELKGHKVAIECVNLLKSKFKDIKLIFVGNGYFESKMKLLVKNLSLENFVSFMGYQSNSIEYMKSSDIILIPSKAEGFGLVALEAYSVKKPIISFNVPALNEIIIHQKTGALVQPYSVDQFSKEIEQLLINNEKRIEYGNNGYNLLKHKFSLNRMTQETIDFYQSCLS